MIKPNAKTLKIKEQVINDLVTDITLIFRVTPSGEARLQLIGDALPFGTYPARDGYVVIVINAVEHWDIFLRVIGRGDLIGDQRYAVLAERTKHGMKLRHW